MRSCLILATATLVGLSACATPPAPSTPARMEAAPSSGPSPLADHDWFFHADDDAARLAYGLRESDDLRLGLDCARGSGRLALSGMAPAGAEPEFHIESGGETERFPAQAEPSQLDDGVFLSAEAATSVPVFQRFRRLGWLALWRDGTRQAYAPQPASAPDIERFFAFCG